MVAGTLYAASLVVGSGMMATGLAILNDTPASTDTHTLYLISGSGKIIGQSASTTAATASGFQKMAFSPGPIWVPAGRYFVGVTSSGTTAKIQTVATNTFIDLVTTSITGTYGTLPTFVVPTTFTADVGPIMYIY